MLSHGWRDTLLSVGQPRRGDEEMAMGTLDANGESGGGGGRSGGSRNNDHRSEYEGVESGITGGR